MLQVEKPIERQGKSPADSRWRWRFSITRLIVATALAPAPLLIFRHGDDDYAGWFLASAAAIFGTAIIIQARELPPVNLLTTMLLACYLLSGNPFLAAMFALPAMLVTRWNYPPATRGALKCDSVIRSSLLLYVALTLLSLPMIDRAFVYGDKYVGLLALAAMVVSLVLNIVWMATDPHVGLEERPDLGFRYESTMVLMPSAILFLLLRNG